MSASFPRFCNSVLLIALPYGFSSNHNPSITAFALGQNNEVPQTVKKLQGGKHTNLKTQPGFRIRVNSVKETGAMTRSFVDVNCVAGSEALQMVDLHSAAKQDDREAVVRLIKEGTNVNKRDPYG